LPRFSIFFLKNGGASISGLADEIGEIAEADDLRQNFRTHSLTRSHHILSFLKEPSSEAIPFIYPN
jgi:hypothetical protein